MVNPVKRLLRKPVRAYRRRALMAKEFYQDYSRYKADAAPPDDAVTSEIGGTNLEAQLTKDYHRVEKGLSLRRPKQPFGASVEQRLTMLLPVANGAATGVPYVGFAEDARAALQTWNAEGTVIDLISPMATVIAPTDAIVLDEFITSRRSVRDFDETRQVDPAIVVEAVRLASHTPSVCNRQAARVHEYRGHENAARILAHQNGNAGFRDQVQNVLVVTVERGLFAGASERNQRWIDGGLFAMTLVWALHGLGVSSCMLNWSMTNDRSDALRAAAGIPSSEDVICMIAIGYPPDGGVRVARSPRRPVEQILTMH